MRFQVLRDAEGWHVFSHELTFDSLMESYGTRRQAITAVQMMRDNEEIAFALAHYCKGDES